MAKTKCAKKVKQFRTMKEYLEFYRNQEKSSYASKNKYYRLGVECVRMAVAETGV